MAEEAITKEYVLGKLREILDNEEVKAKDKLTALKLAGDYLKMFNSKMEIDIRALLAQVSSGQLKGLADVRIIEGSCAVELEGTGSGDNHLPESVEHSVQCGPDMGNSKEDERAPGRIGTGSHNRQTKPKGHRMAKGSTAR